MSENFKFIMKYISIAITLVMLYFIYSYELVYAEELPKQGYVGNISGKHAVEKYFIKDNEYVKEWRYISSPSEFIVTVESSINVASYKPVSTITIRKDAENTATIYFGGDQVSYAGNLSVDEAAKLFFDAVMKQERTCR